MNEAEAADVKRRISWSTARILAMPHPPFGVTIECDGAIGYATISGTIYDRPVRIAPDVVVDITDPLYDAWVHRCGPVARNVEGSPW